MQSRSVLSFKPFQIERSTEDTLPSYIKGAALFDKVDSEEGHWVFDVLSSDYLAVEYEEDKNQWYFIDQDSCTGNWITTDVVPLSRMLRFAFIFEVVISRYD